MLRGRTSMPEEDLKLAIREAIQAEKDAMDFYRFAADRMFNEKARLTFKVLAGEEREHARAFYQAYTWGDLPPFEDLIEAPPNTRSSWWQALQQASLGGLDEQQALSLALEQERSLEDRLRAMADKVGDPQIRAVYLANANMTQRHFQVISEDCQAVRPVYH